MKEQRENHRKPADQRTRRAKHQDPTGPDQDQRTRGPKGVDQRTKGPRDQGTKAPVDQRTKGPEDPQTTGPGEQQKRPIKEYFVNPLLSIFDPLSILLMLFF